MVDDMEEDLKEPRATIRSWLKPMKRFPGLIISLLHDVFGLRVITQNMSRRAKQVVQVRQRVRFKRLNGACRVRSCLNRRIHSGLLHSAYDLVGAARLLAPRQGFFEIFRKERRAVDELNLATAPLKKDHALITPDERHL